VSAVFPRSDNSGMAVFVLDHGRARIAAVDVAARNGADAWVRQGLQEGTVVIVYPPSTVRDGARVRPRRV
jgi:HlyD family secretion protein